MDKQELDKKITEAAKSILSYCMVRTSGQAEAEDLAQDIIVEIYKSATNIRNDNAFYGFMWSVAGNVYKQWCKRKQRNCVSELTEEISENLPEPEMPEGDLSLLRRELSLLAEKYRRATILYYIENKSCSQISQILSVSESMVKYLLFKSRQILKEGMSMERDYGQQSYNPKGLALGFWGNGTNRYYNLCKSKISQNILFACYNDRLTAQQISVEIGVALPYMEDNLKELCEYEVLKKDGNKYYTNIVIFTKELEEEVHRKTAESYEHIADLLAEAVSRKEAEVRALGFAGAEMNSNSFAWQMVSFLLYRAIIVKLQNRANIVYPVDKFGVSCYAWGLEKDLKNPEDIQFFVGVSDRANDKGDWIQFMDFLINCDDEMSHNYFFNRQDAVNIFLDVAGGATEHFSENDRVLAADMVKKGFLYSDKGKLYVNVPVFSENQYNALVSMFDESAETVAAEAEKMMAVAAEVLKNHIPSHLKKYAKDMAFLKTFDDAVAGPVRVLYQRKYLLSYNGEKYQPTTYIVLK